MEPVANTGWQPLEESVDSRTDVICQVGKTDLPYYCDCRTLPALLQLGAVPGRPVQPLFECQPTPVVISHARRREGSLRASVTDSARSCEDRHGRYCRIGRTIPDGRRLVCTPNESVHRLGRSIAHFGILPSLVSSEAFVGEVEFS